MAPAFAGVAIRNPRQLVLRPSRTSGGGCRSRTPVRCPQSRRGPASCGRAACAWALAAVACAACCTPPSAYNARASDACKRASAVRPRGHAWGPPRAPGFWRRSPSMAARSAEPHSSETAAHAINFNRMHMSARHTNDLAFEPPNHSDYGLPASAAPTSCFFLSMFLPGHSNAQCEW